jgi:hypothetical protein
MIRHRLPWVVLVLGSASTALAQVTVREEPEAPAPPESSIQAAAREGRAISISNGRLGTRPGEQPEFHTVERGDTLWDISGAYFENPWRWPQVWGLNPQITNPHWIYPGDQVRLRPSGQGSATRSIPVSGATPASAPAPARVAPATVFLRDEGWLDRDEAEAAGTIVGSPEDQMLLSEGDRAYVEFRRRTPHVGESFTIYQEAHRARGGDRASGHVVRVIGTATVERWDRERHIATVRITESLDSIERGERVAAIPRRLQAVPPVTNTVNLRAHIVATVQPRELVGQHMVVFLDRGAEDGVARGNRLFVVRRGDAWQASLTTSAAAASGRGLDRDGDGRVDAPPGSTTAAGNLPEEIVGEILVVDVRPRSATAIVTSSISEVTVGDVLEMRRGY